MPYPGACHLSSRARYTLAKEYCCTNTRLTRLSRTALVPLATWHFIAPCKHASFTDLSHAVMCGEQVAQPGLIVDRWLKNTRHALPIYACHSRTAPRAADARLTLHMRQLPRACRAWRAESGCGRSPTLRNEPSELGLRTLGSRALVAPPAGVGRARRPPMSA